MVDDTLIGGGLGLTHVEDFLFEARIDEDVEHCFLVAGDEFIVDLVDDHEEFKVSNLSAVSLDESSKVIDDFVDPIKTNAFVVAKQLAEEFYLAEVSIHVREELGDVAAQRELVGWVVFDVEREKAKGYLEHLFELEEAHGIRLLVDEEDRVFDEVDPELVNFEMLHDVLSDGVYFGGLHDDQLVVLIETRFREHQVGELREEIAGGVERQHVLWVRQVLNPGLALVHVFGQPTTQLLTLLEYPDVVVIEQQ